MNTPRHRFLPGLGVFLLVACGYRSPSLPWPPWGEGAEFCDPSCPSYLSSRATAVVDVQAGGVYETTSDIRSVPMRFDLCPGTSNPRVRRHYPGRRCRLPR